MIHAAIMTRAGYDLADLGTPAHMPGWAKDLAASTQKVMDDQYLHGAGGLDNYYGQADGWLQTQAVLRGSNRAYVAPPFAMPVPRRQMVTFDDADGNLSSAFLPADPRILAPVLDPLPDAPPAGPVFGGPHPPSDPAPMFGSVMAELTVIRGQIEDLRALIISRA